MNKSLIYLAGVDHLVQYRNSIVPEYLFAEFEDFIAGSIREYDISAIAEEFNREYLDDVYFSSGSTVESAALKAGVFHIFCDPGRSERLKLGIPYYADIREIVKEKYGIHEKIVTDRKVHEKIESETAAESKKFWRVREEYWYSQFKHLSHKNILFICGHEHVMSFKELIEMKGHRAVVLEPFWHEDIFSHYTVLGLQ